MSNPDTEEKLRKLASIDEETALGHWQHYLSGEGTERFLADDLIDILLHQELGKDYRKRREGKPEEFKHAL